MAIYILNISIKPRPGAGGVEWKPRGPTYESGTVVVLKAVPYPSYRFVKWSGDASGDDLLTTITMNSDKEAVANFEEIPWDKPMFTLSTSIVGSGTVSPSTGKYQDGSSIIVTATPSLGHKFDHWSGDASGTQTSITVKMDKDKTATAHFTKKEEPAPAPPPAPEPPPPIPPPAPPAPEPERIWWAKQMVSSLTIGIVPVWAAHEVITGLSVGLTSMWAARNAVESLRLSHSSIWQLQDMVGHVPVRIADGLPPLPPEELAGMNWWPLIITGALGAITIGLLARRK